MNIFSRFIAFIFEFWHKHVSPGLPAACRHEPTCSVYAAQALRQHGLFSGLWLAAKRLARCQPWGTQGWDPVPLKLERSHTKSLIG